MIRYKVNILDELKKAGYTSYRMRNEKILAESTMQKLRMGSTSIYLESLDIICELLHCQIGDLVEWLPNEQAACVEKG